MIALAKPQVSKIPKARAANRASQAGAGRALGRAKIANGADLTTLSQIMVRIAAICKRVFAKFFRSWPFGRNLCGHRHAFAEKQLVLRAGKGRSGLVAQIVHAAEELAIHHERKIAPHG